MTAKRITVSCISIPRIYVENDMVIWVTDAGNHKLRMSDN